MSGVSGGKLSSLAASMVRMDAISLFAGLLVGALLGGAIGYLYARGRLASATADLTAQAREWTQIVQRQEPRLAGLPPKPGPARPLGADTRSVAAELGVSC